MRRLFTEESPLSVTLQRESLDMTVLIQCSETVLVKRLEPQINLQVGHVLCFNIVNRTQLYSRDMITRKISRYDWFEVSR